MAEEVSKIYPDLVTTDDAGRPQAIRYQFLVPMLVNEVQKDRRTIASQEERIDELSRRLEALESRGH